MGATLRGLRDLIQVAARRAGQGQSDLTRGFAEALQGSAHAHTRGDRGGRDRVKWLTGTTLDDKPVKFRPSKVWSMLLTDANDIPIGVTFVRSPGYYYANLHWAKQETRDADTKVTGVRLRGRDIAEKDPPEDAPWADTVRKTGNPPNYFMAHSYPHFAKVSINTGTERAPKWIEVKLNGSELGLMLEAHENSARVIGRNSAGEQVLIMCSAGATDASVGPMAAAHLRSTGTVTGNIHAPTGVVSTSDSMSKDGRVRTSLSVERSIPDGKLFETYPAPGNRPMPPEGS
ncbi:hypothetical protein ACW9HQ_32705 [Nocardia gipuzkoensis]